MRYAEGDHLAVPRVGYTHHAVYVGDGYVVQNTREGVDLVTLEEFSRGRPVEVIPHEDRAFSRSETVMRALSRVGQKEYSLLSFNCEHFVSWCISGEYRSPQVRSAAANAAGIALAATQTLIAISKAKDRAVPPAARGAVALGVDAAAAATGTLMAVKAAKALLKAADTAARAHDIAQTLREGGADFETAVKAAGVSVGLGTEVSGAVARGVSDGLKRVRRGLKGGASREHDPD